MRVVFVPGFTQTAASWRPLIGGSLRDSPIEPLALDVPDGLDFAATASAIGDLGGNAAYVGYSMGGRLCLQLALDRPDLVDRLVLVSASPGIADPTERAARRAVDDELARDVERDGVEAFLERWLAQPMFATLPSAMAGLEERRRANSVERLTHQLRVLGQGSQPSNWDRLNQVRARSLLFAGRRDPKYVAIAERMVVPLRASVRIVDAGHACHLESPLLAHLLSSWFASE
jgi:2-succinyl-6-hydroxy-2,4-cyclohexadiene-1-carboxylate synthase